MSDTFVEEAEEAYEDVGFFPQTPFRKSSATTRSQNRREGEGRRGGAVGVEEGVILEDKAREHRGRGEENRREVREGSGRENREERDQWGGRDDRGGRWELGGGGSRGRGGRGEEERSVRDPQRGRDQWGIGGGESKEERARESKGVWEERGGREKRGEREDGGWEERGRMEERRGKEDIGRDERGGREEGKGRVEWRVTDMRREGEEKGGKEYRGVRDERGGERREREERGGEKRNDNRSGVIPASGRWRTTSDTETRHSPRNILDRDTHLQPRLASSTDDRDSPRYLDNSNLQLPSPRKLSSTSRDRKTSSSSTTSSTALSKSVVNLVDEAEKHQERVPLNTPWTYWLDKSCKGYSQADYEAALRKIYTVKTVEGFWSVYNNIPGVEKLQSSCSYHLMRHEIRPLWEDKENQNGGTWRLKCPKSDSERVWKELLLACIGEQLSAHLDEDDDLIGITIAVRDRDDLIQIWNRESSLAEDREIVQIIRNFVPEVEFITSFYKPHQTHHAFQHGPTKSGGIHPVPVVASGFLSAGAASSPLAAMASSPLAAMASSPLAAMASSPLGPLASGPRSVPPPGFQTMANQVAQSSPIRIPPFPPSVVEAASSPRVASLPINIAASGATLPIQIAGSGAKNIGHDGFMGSSPFGVPPPPSQIVGSSSPFYPPGCSPHVPPPNWNPPQNLSDSQRDRGRGGGYDFGSLSKLLSSSPSLKQQQQQQQHLQPRPDSGGSLDESFTRVAIDEEDDAVLAVGSPPFPRLSTQQQQQQQQRQAQPPPTQQYPSAPMFGSSSISQQIVGSPPTAQFAAQQQHQQKQQHQQAPPLLFGSPPGPGFGGVSDSGSSPALGSSFGTRPPPGFGTSPNVRPAIPPIKGSSPMNASTTIFGGTHRGPPEVGSPPDRSFVIGASLGQSPATTAPRETGMAQLPATKALPGADQSPSITVRPGAVTAEAAPSSSATSALKTALGTPSSTMTTPQGAVSGAPSNFPPPFPGFGTSPLINPPPFPPDIDLSKPPPGFPS